MVYIFSGEFHQPLQDFLHKIQPIVGKILPDAHNEAKVLHVEETAQATSEDLEGLRNMVEELKDTLRQNEENMAKIRREKNELMLKVSKAQAEVQERDKEIESLKNPPRTGKSKVEEKNGREEPAPEDGGASSPPSPPPPPPPIPSSVTSCVAPVRRTCNPDHARRRSARMSKYLHPLALNLCFSTLKSLHENNVSSPSQSPTSPTDSAFSYAPFPSQEKAVSEWQQPTPAITMKVLTNNSYFFMKMFDHLINPWFSFI